LLSPCRHLSRGRRRAARALRLAYALPLALALAACGGAEAPGGGARAEAAAEQPVTVTDDAGHRVTLPRPARRIVALMPSATETLVAIGAGPLLVGRTDFDRGPGVDSLPSVGGGMDPSIEKVVALRPDLVLGWAEKKDTKIRSRLEELGIPVFSVSTTDTADVYRMLRNLGALTGREDAAGAVADSLRAELEAVRASVAGLPRPTAFYVVWNDPPMTTGGGTFLHELVGLAGGRNVFGDLGEPWPTVSMEEVVRRDPDVLVLPVGEKGGGRADQIRTAPGWRELRAVREGRVVLVPSELMNRPGPAIGQAARALRDALHPERARR
jgi:iron complex transport system substrate-binding protein